MGLCTTCIKERVKKGLLLVGLDASGKTTILHKLVYPKQQPPAIPTVGFNVESFKYKNSQFIIWDVGGAEKLRDLWNHYYPQTDVVLFVVDSSDRERIPIAKHKLHQMLKEKDLENTDFAILCNKQDLKGVMNANDIKRELGLHLNDTISHPLIQLFECSAINGDGLFETLDWIVQNIKNTSIKTHNDNISFIDHDAMIENGIEVKYEECFSESRERIKVKNDELKDNNDNMFVHTDSLEPMTEAVHINVGDGHEEDLEPNPDDNIDIKFEVEKNELNVQQKVKWVNETLDENKKEEFRDIKNDPEMKKQKYGKKKKVFDKASRVQRIAMQYNNDGV